MFAVLYKKHMLHTECDFRLHQESFIKNDLASGPLDV